MTKTPISLTPASMERSLRMQMVKPGTIRAGGAIQSCAVEFVHDEEGTGRVVQESSPVEVGQAG